jgi:hypothetical protein
MRGLLTVGAGLLFACGSPDEDTDTGTPTPPQETDEYQGCEQTEIDAMGPDTPQVGDEWTVWMRCDGALLQGPMVIRFTPPDFANLDANVVLFTTAGEASMLVQVGSYRETMSLAVLP